VAHHEPGQVLGLDRFEIDALLKRNDVTEYALAHEDLDADVSNLKEFLRFLLSKAAEPFSKNSFYQV
jgi:hypothetical protein